MKGLCVGGRDQCNGGMQTEWGQVETWLYMLHGIGICMHIYGIWYWYMYEYIWYGIGISMYGVWYWYIYGIMEYGKTWLGPMVSTMETEWEQVKTHLL